MSDIIIKFSNIEKIYQLKGLEIKVLSNINLEIKKGDLIAIVGPSGSGKSTLMNIIGLLDRPTKGDYLLENEKITLNMSDKKLAKIRAEKIGFVFQSFNLLPKETAFGNVMMPSIYDSQNNAAKRARRLLREVGLEERCDHKPNELSGGENQRVAIARSLINDPEIILADEPTGNLDSKSGKQVIEILKKLNKEGKTIIIITHDEKIAEGCPRIIRLFDGKIQGGEKSNAL